MTHPTDEELDALDAKLASQIGDDVAVIFNHEYLFKQSRDAITALRAALSAIEPADPVTNAGSQPVKVKHVKRGTSYLVVGAGKVQTDTPLRDYDDVVVYQGETDGLLWIRPTAEFEDGRFAALEAAPHVNETPKSEHDSADMLTDPPAAVAKALEDGGEV